MIEINVQNLLYSFFYRFQKCPDGDDCVRSHSSKELKEWKKFDTNEQSKKFSSSSEVVSKALKKAFRDANYSAVILNTGL